MVFATVAFLGAFGADQGLLTYFADLSGPGLPYIALDSFCNLCGGQRAEQTATLTCPSGDASRLELERSLFLIS